MASKPAQQVTEIVSLLLDATRASKLAWTADTVEEGRFTAPLGDTIVKIDQSGSDSWTLSLHNKEGYEVESYWSLSQEVAAAARPMFAAVYQLARKQALRTDQVVASVISELKKRAGQP